MSIKIEIDPNWRAYVGELIKLYVRNVECRIFVAFDNLGSEIDLAKEEAFQLCMSIDADDPFGAYDSAMDHAINMYTDLDFVRSEINGLAVIGLFHVLERFLKEYFERGFRWQRTKPNKFIASWNFNDITTNLKEVGFELAQHSFGHRITALQRLTNTLKHGEGQSRQKLREVAPELFDRDLNSVDWENVLLSVDEMLLTRAEFRELADAVEAMWAALPVGVVQRRTE